MKAADVKAIADWIRRELVRRNGQWVQQAAWEECAKGIEQRFLPTVKVEPGAKHQLENNACYSFRCGACGKSWTESWGSMDDLTGLDPEPGMEAVCEHCGTELSLANWDPDMEGMYDESD
jgi:hypothetical protein